MKEHQEEWLELCRQASVEQDREKLFDLVCRINELLEVKDKRLQQSSTPEPRDGDVGIFQIAYDKNLLTERAELLSNRGYKVGSALGNDDAQHVLANGRTYRLFIVGHAAAKETREEMVRWLKTNFPRTRVLALNPPEAPNLTAADYNLVLNGPEEWLSIVANAV